jgi:hypothetical protein
MLVPFVMLQSWLVAGAHAARARARSDRLAGDAGQTTAEYALVLIGAAAIAVLLITWATKTDLIGKLFGWVMERVMGSAD